jgi:hypothetical protein
MRLREISRQAMKLEGLRRKLWGLESQNLEISRRCVEELDVASRHMCDLLEQLIDRTLATECALFEIEAAATGRRR